MQTVESSLIIPANKLVRILLVEDEPGNAASLTEVLESFGYSVQVASNPTDAKLALDAMKFGMVISDQVFDGHTVRGDSFLLEDEAKIADIPKVLVTGWGTEGILRKEELDQRGITILEKGHEDFHPRLEEIAHEALEIAKRKVIQSVEANSESTENRDGERALQEARGLLLGWLRSRQDKDAQEIYYSGQKYSVNMLIDEIEKRTPVGEAHMLLFIKVLRKAMRI